MFEFRQFPSWVFEFRQFHSWVFECSAVSLLGFTPGCSNFGSFTSGFHSWVFECSSVSFNLSTRKTNTKTYHLYCNHPSRLDCVHAVSNNNLANGCSPRAKLTEEGTTETLRSETFKHSGAKPSAVSLLEVRVFECSAVWVFECSAVSLLGVQVFGSLTPGCSSVR